ncbi:NCS2 family permease [Rhodovastum atsumiense]|uniref:NCS2 family permease n=1 Tax=Rhodovastum atsumiense TaxID=504468 RepID=A0A5M6IJC7_9PROT|nr:NCS2 family permease [Rhodovastum atsumiense]KAA5608361.1 NCS2 family permease [Rhodovastum atsumiense]CAH2600496.1 NCS2 family permease [Rhodovastum atsumiense]
MNVVSAYFRFAEAGTNLRTEILAGITTWLAMVYIVAVNPGILATTGMDHGAVFAATCIGAGLASIAMGLYANYPLALAPGMGLNAYFAFVVVGGMHVPWQVALGAVFLSGLLFLAVSLLRLREWLINTIPLSLKLGIGAGIGLFLALIGLEGMGLVVAHPATLVTLGHLATTKTLLGCLGFVVMAALAARGVSASVLIGILVTAAAGIPFGLTNFTGIVSAPPSIAPTFLQMDISGALGLGIVSVVLTFFLVDLLDNAGTLIATTHRAGLMRPDGTVPRLRQALTADSGGAIMGSVLGTSTVTSYIESAAGIQAGGRTGLAAVVTGLLFLATMFFAPLATSIPGFATAPALVFVACLMARALRDVNWDDMTDYLPAIVTAIAMPFTFSIATGIGVGFIVHALVKTLAGRPREVGGAVWLIAVASAAKFALQ